MSFKLSPFYNYTNSYQEQSYLGPNFVTQAPVGAFRSYGVEASLQKGDFSREGLSGQIALTYTNAKVQYQSFFGVNQLDSVNSAITEFNKLTQAGGGSSCYKPSTDPTNGNAGVGDPVACTYTGAAGGAIFNPYFSMSPQGTLATEGWYAPGDTGL